MRVLLDFTVFRRRSLGPAAARSVVEEGKPHRPTLSDVSVAIVAHPFEGPRIEPGGTSGGWRSSRTSPYCRRTAADLVSRRVAAIVGIVVGVPGVIALGRCLWDLVACVPGQMAARTPTAVVLRAE
jgi:hypothetical protein